MNIRTLKVLILLTLSNNILICQQKFQYGDNQEAGKYQLINEIRLYYEEYGQGEPLLLINGNGFSIKEMKHQIDYFKSKYRVIIVDSRGHGKSELKTDSLTYRLMAQDYLALVDKLNLKPVNIIGWSDGAIISLIMGIQNPNKINKIVAMGGNLRPDSTAVHQWAIDWVNSELKKVEKKIEVKDTAKDWYKEKQLLRLMAFQPNIKTSELSTIKAPVLVVVGDDDIIKIEHTLEIFNNLKKAQLCVLPGDTHFSPIRNPKVFNRTVERFFDKLFSRPTSNWTEN